MVKIRFQQLSIDGVSNSSGVFKGDNRQTRWRHAQKVNEGFGSMSGEKNTATRHVSVVFDDDVLDVRKNKPKHAND